jgi:hypothetical protein
MLRVETKVLAPFRRVAAKATQAPWTEAITPSLAALFRQDIRIDSSAARNALWLPQTTPEQMVAAVLRDDRTKQELALS